MGEWFYFMSRPRVVTGKRLFYAQFDFNSILLLFVCLLFVFFFCVCVSKILFIHPTLTSYRRFTSTPCCCTAKICLIHMAPVSAEGFLMQHKNVKKKKTLFATCH